MIIQTFKIFASSIPVLSVAIFCFSCGQTEKANHKDPSPRSLEAEQVSNESPAGGDTSVTAIRMAEIGIRKEIAKLNEASKQLSSTTNASMGLQLTSSSSSTIATAARNLEIAADALVDQNAEIEGQLAENFTQNDDNELELKGIRQLMDDSEEFQNQLIADARAMAIGGESEVLGDLNEKLSSLEADAESLKASIPNDAQEILRAVAANPIAAEYLEMTNLRAYSAPEAITLRNTISGIHSVLSPLRQRYELLNRSVDRFRLIYRLDRPSAAIESLTKALAQYESKSQEITETTDVLTSTALTMNDSLSAFSTLIDRAKSANQRLEELYEEIRIDSAGGILAEVSKLEGAKSVISELLATESRPQIQVSLNNILEILTTSIGNLSTIAAQLQAAMQAAEDLLTEQRALIADQNQITALQSEYLAAIESEQKKIAETIASNEDTRASLHELLTQLENWADHAADIADRHAASLQEAIAPLRAAIKYEDLRYLVWDAQFLRSNIDEAIESQRQELRLLRVADAVLTRPGLSTATARNAEVWFQLERISGLGIRELDPSQKIYTGQGEIKDLIIRGHRESQYTVIRFVEIEENKTTLNILFGNVENSAVDWKHVRVSENHVRMSSVSLDKQGRVAISWKEPDDMSYLRLYTKDAQEIGSRLDLRVDNRTCNRSVSVSMAPGGDWGIVGCLSSVPNARGFDDTHLTERRFKKDATWHDAQFVDHESVYPEVAIADDGQFFAAGRLFGSDRVSQLLGPSDMSYDTKSEYYQDREAIYYYNGDTIGGIIIQRSTPVAPDYRGPSPAYALGGVSTLGNGFNLTNSEKMGGLIGTIANVSNQPLNLSQYLTPDTKFSLLDNQNFASSSPPREGRLSANYDKIAIENGRVTWQRLSDVRVLMHANWPADKRCGGQHLHSSSQSDIAILNSGQMIRSCNGQYKLRLNDDGELVHLGPNDQILWSSVSGKSGSTQPSRPEMRGEKLIFTGVNETIAFVDEFGEQTVLSDPKFKRKGTNEMFLNVSDHGHLVLAVSTNREVFPIYFSDVFQANIEPQ